MATKAKQEMEQETQETKETQAPDEWSIMREVYVPHVRGEEKTLPVSVNNRDYAVPKGKRELVPLPVYYVVENKLEQMRRAEEEAEKELTVHDRGIIR